MVHGLNEGHIAPLETEQRSWQCYTSRDHSWYGLSQWKEALLCNALSIGRAHTQNDPLENIDRPGSTLGLDIKGYPLFKSNLIWPSDNLNSKAPQYLNDNGRKKNVLTHWGLEIKETTVLILGLRPANERCRYFVTTSLIADWLGANPESALYYT